MRNNGKAGASLRPFFGYFGGKWRDTPRLYPSPAFPRIVEPFAGSAGYSLRYPDREVILFERDPVVASVWDFLIKVEPKEILDLPDVLPGQSVDDIVAPQEARWLIGFWLNRGVARPRKRPSKWMRDGVRPGSFWGERVRKTIASQVRQIRHWKVHNKSYDKCRLRKDATWFVDPPYTKSGRHYRFGPEEIDYRSLADWCRRRPGQVIVCENAGAKWLPFRHLSRTKTTRKSRISVEVSWVKSPSENGHP